MALHIYNYLHRKKEIFKPMHKGFVGLYVCGPTVYSHAHIGHTKVYITFDILHRYLGFLGYKVRYVQNITDIGHLTGDGDVGEDKIEKLARLKKQEPMEIAEYYTRSYFEDMDKLNIIRPHISPRASGHVPEQIEMAQTLIDKGYAYEANGSVFFEVGKWPTYGKLSGHKTEELAEGVRIEVDSNKRDARDFAVWRKANPGHIMRWQSPWGEGFPGWHAECTVMAMKYLGLPFDIHGGGLENIFPHNESEVAQCEAAYDKEFARYWMLNNMVTVDGTKMGKSLGNFTTIKDALQRHNPMTIRFFILNSHYRSPTDFSEAAFEAAARGYERLTSSRKLLNRKKQQADEKGKTNSSLNQQIQNTRNSFQAAMDDDLNTPQALSHLFDFTRELNRLLHDEQQLNKQDLQQAELLLSQLGGDVLGLFTEEEAGNKAATQTADGLIKLLIDLRQQARAQKDWQTADKIRQQLEQLGITLEDGTQETTWKYI